MSVVVKIISVVNLQSHRIVAFIYGGCEPASCDRVCGIDVKSRCKAGLPQNSTLNLCRMPWAMLGQI